jgi:uncharacterized UPF0146 family protein
MPVSELEHRKRALEAATAAIARIHPLDHHKASVLATDANAAIKAAEPHLRAIERDRILKLAEEAQAVYSIACPAEHGDCTEPKSFADLIRRKTGSP